ncbi:MAG: N-acetylmuramoyl-L-alanine amidase [Leptolyngbya sp. SIO1D8]|nr:N-acetylmuramoyl-L-alanine amidase [Leptolyngbya sp. SIO1D8]
MRYFGGNFGLRFDRLIPASLGIVSALVVTVPAEAAQLQSWWFNARENQLVFTTDTGVQPRAQMIFNPTRIVIDLPGTTLAGPPTSQSVGGAIREVRSGQFDAQTSRLVIELNAGYSLNPRNIEVRGVSNTRWIVQLPEATRSETTPTTTTTGTGNAVNGQFVRGVDTFVDGVNATPDGFFIRTRGNIPELNLERQGESGRERQITMTLPGTSISPFLRSESLPLNRYGVSRWEITQEQRPATTRITMTLAPTSPDWEISTTNLGGIVILPPSGVSINDVPDQNPRVNQPIAVPPSSQQPGLPPQPQIPNNVPRVNQGQLLVAIDPGHGGQDPGAIGIGGLQEKTVVLPLSLRVAEILRAAGVQVVMTRADDRTLDLQPRVDIANQANATIFLSIHANAISLSRPDVNGLETYYASDSGQRLASIIHANALPVSGLNDRGVKQARFYVLRHTNMPAALIELGFLTGQDDVQRLADPAWRERMAQAIAQGILQYLQIYR